MKDTASICAFLRKVPLFSDLTGEDLETLTGLAEMVHTESGEVLFSEGDPGDAAYVVQEGELEILKETAGRRVLLAVRVPGDVVGEMALLEQSPRTATIRTRKPATLLRLSREQFEGLIKTSPTAAHGMLLTVTARWRATEAQLLQSEKMAQLGTLTAGVTHELNNPSAAVMRASSQLDEAVEKFHEADERVHGIGLSPEQAERIHELEHATHAGEGDGAPLDALERSDLESEIEAWLEGQAVPEPWDLAPGLVASGFTRDELEEVAASFESDQLGAVLEWICSQTTIRSLIGEIRSAAERISEIVKAVKAYAYLDQAPVQLVDVHEGIESTLVLMRHKLGSGVTVEKEFTGGLPRFEAYASELNQVWTNLIDNAVDAMEGEGTLTIRTRQEGDWVVVEVEDSGSGIPQEVQTRIFDPFFTTKPQGKGTGLGLNTSYNIITYKHRGEIRVESEPGQTCFQVWLPTSGGPGAGPEE